MQAMKPKGGCYCGLVRFEVELPSLWVAHCHCENCRSAHSAAFVTWAGFRSERFSWIAGEEQLSRFRTDTQATRTFCKTCGTTLLFESPRWEGETHIAYACFDADVEGSIPLDKQPKAHAYADRAVPWCTVDSNLPRFGGADGNEPLDERARAIHSEMNPES